MLLKVLKTPITNLLSDFHYFRILGSAFNGEVPIKVVPAGAGSALLRVVSTIQWRMYKVNYINLLKLADRRDLLNIRLLIISVDYY